MSTCILLSSSAPVPFPADTVGDGPKFREEQHHCNKAVRKATLLAYVPNRKLFLRTTGASFSITVYLTASTRTVPDARSHSPTSSSQALRSDESSDTAFRDQSKRAIHVCAALQTCIAWRLHGCQGDRISFDFASVHRLLRDCADEAHVDSEPEAKVLIPCIVSIERWQLAQASQVLERFGIKRFRHIRSSAASSWICGFNGRAALVSEKLADEMT